MLMFLCILLLVLMVEMCPHEQRGRGGQPKVDSWRQREGGGRQNVLEMCGHLLWMAPSSLYAFWLNIEKHIRLRPFLNKNIGFVPQVTKKGLHGYYFSSKFSKDFQSNSIEQSILQNSFKQRFLMLLSYN